MTLKSVAALAVLLWTSVVVVRGQQSTQDTENYIKLSEQQWAEASMKRDTATVERILADDFVAGPSWFVLPKSGGVGKRLEE